MIDEEMLKDIAACATCLHDVAEMTLSLAAKRPEPPDTRRIQGDLDQAQRVLEWVQAQRKETEPPQGANGQPLAAKLLDEGFPPNEQFPRRMEVSIDLDDHHQAVTTVNGVRMGNPLRNNRYEEDGYRFHDVFHIAHAAMLGWSPTLRAMMGRKRKRDAWVDEVEDGGRARVIEEGIVAMVFSYAERRNFLEDPGEIDQHVLSAIREMTQHLEVSVRTDREWAQAIKAGFRVWRRLKADSGGQIRVDLEERTMKLLGGKD